MDERLRKFDCLVKAAQGPALKLLLLLAMPLWAADTTNSLPEPIPALLPPREEIPPGFWEQHGLWVILVAGILVCLLAVALWWLTLPKAVVPMPPAEAARRALEPLRSRPEDGLLLSQVSQVLRRYIMAAFGMPEAELTTSEFCQAIDANTKIEPVLAADLGQFLRGCDELKFAPAAARPPAAAVDRALEFIERAEARLRALREVSAPAPAGSPESESSIR